MFKDPTFKEVMGWVLKKKSVTRALMNSGLKNYSQIDGIVIDLGGGGLSSYKKIINFSGQYINMDASEDARPTVVGNLEDKHPFPDDYADAILLFNVLEHVFNYEHVVREARRVINRNGRVIVFVPFLMPYHTFKTTSFFIDDYFRYTESSLIRIFMNNGFTNVKVKPVGGLFLALANFGSYVLKYRIFQAPFVALCFFVESVFKKIKPDSAQKYPVGYFLEAKP
jgi:SAM-dependent methyltransferase